MANVPDAGPPSECALTSAAHRLETEHPDWRISVENGRLIARHRSEEFDPRREQWGTLTTTVRAATPQQMRDRLDLQQALRSGEASP